MLGKKLAICNICIIGYQIMHLKMIRMMTAEDRTRLLEERIVRQGETDVTDGESSTNTFFHCGK